MKKKNVIKATMVLKEIKVKEIATRARVDGSMVDKVISGTRKSEKVNRVIEDLLQPELNMIEEIEVKRRESA